MEGWSIEMNFSERGREWVFEILVESSEYSVVGLLFEQCTQETIINSIINHVRNEVRELRNKHIYA